MAGAALTVGLGFTVTVNVVKEEHPLGDVAVTVKVVVCCTLVMLVKVPVILVAVPLFAMPVRLVVLSLTQLNVVPATAFGLVIVMPLMAMAEQTVCEVKSALTVGVGLTATVAVIGVPGQPLAVGVMVNVTVSWALVVLVNVPLTLPLPLAAMPVTFTVLFLVQL